MIHNLEISQNQSKNCHLMMFSIDESLVSAVAPAADGILEGTYLATAFKNGTGDYSITFKRACRRTPIVIGIVPIGLVDVRFNISELTTEGFRVVAEVGGTDTNCDFHATVVIFGDAVQC